MWYTSQPAKWGPSTSHSCLLPSEVSTKAPLRVPTNNRTRLIATQLLEVADRATAAVASKPMWPRGAAPGLGDEGPGGTAPD